MRLFVGLFVVPRIILHKGNQCTKFEVFNFIISRDILEGRGVKNLQEALQMQRDCVTCHEYKILHLKRLAIEE